MFPSICGYFSTFGILVSVSFIFCLFFFIYFSYGIDICGASTFCLLTCTNVGIIDGALFPLIILWALAYVISYSFLAFDHEVPPSSTLLFLFKTLLRDFAITFLLFSNVTCISSLVLLTLVCGFYGLVFMEKIDM